MVRAIAIAVFISGCAYGARQLDDPSEHDAGVSDATSSELTIMALRDPAAPEHAAFGSMVSLGPSVVTDVKSVGNSKGFFIQHATAQSWAAIYVFVGGVTPAVTAGDLVRVSGIYSPYLGLEEIDARSGSITTIGRSPRPEPLDVSIRDIEENGTRTTELQSMRVRLTNVVAVSGTAGLDFIVGDSNSGARIPVTSYMANDNGPTIVSVTDGERFVTITGHAYTANLAKIAPMTPADVVAY